MERFWTWVAWRLPRPLVKWCALRVFAHATCIVHSDRTPSEVTILDAIKAWDERIVSYGHRAVLEPTFEPGDLVECNGATLRVRSVSQESFAVLEHPSGIWYGTVPVFSLTLLPPE